MALAKITNPGVGIVITGDPVNYQFLATGGAGFPYTFTAEGMPGWLNLTASGHLTGTSPSFPWQRVTFPVTVFDQDDVEGCTSIVEIALLNFVY